jgi:hypothetical protein
MLAIIWFCAIIIISILDTNNDNLIKGDFMKPIYFLVLIVVLLASCSSAPSFDAVATSVAATVAAQAVQQEQVLPAISQPTHATAPTATQVPTSTPKPTNTPGPTRTRVPTRTFTATVSIEQSRSDFIFIITAALQEGIKQGVLDIESFDTVRIANGRLEIEATTKWASQDRQPVVSRDIVQYCLAVMVPGVLTAEEAAYLVGSDKFTVNLVTYSTDGDYRYESTTDYDTLVQVKNKSITYDEWVTASNAGFR